MIEKSRGFYGYLSGFVAVLCNLLLFVAKVIVGTLFGSMATVADAFNNLSDLGSNIVSLVGFKVASLPADKEHPYGHARAEYIAAMVVAFIVLFLGVELVIGSVEQIITPVGTEFSYLTVAVLAAGVLVKLFMFLFNRALGKKIDSPVLRATAMDSLADVASSSAVILSLFIGIWTGVDLDAYMTIGVAAFILFAGFKIIKETFSELLGRGASKATAESIKRKVLSYEGVLGVHDLMVHDYGSGKVFASVHVEVDANKPILESHDLIDRIEMDFAPEMALVIHLDPIVTDNEEVNHLRRLIQLMVEQIDVSLTMHDFRVVFGNTHTNLIFDVVIPYESKLNPTTITAALNEEVSKLGKQYYLVINYDRDFHD